MKQRFAVMGAGEVGFHLARTLSHEGHSVVVIENDSEAGQRVEEELDVQVVPGNGSHVPVLESAKVKSCDLFMAVSSSDESNLAASVLAKRMGAQRSVVRVGVAEDVTTHRRVYEDVFSVDLLLSTQLLSTTRILNHILGHNTLAVEYLARGKVQLRKVHLAKGTVLTRRALRDVEMPAGSLVVAFYRDEELIIPSGDDRAQFGDDALIVCKTEVIDRVERLVSARPSDHGTTVLAGGGQTAHAVLQALSNQVDKLVMIERDRERAEYLAATFPKVQVLNGDATDPSLLRSERIGDARSFVALTGNDERNLMACLLAEELGVGKVIALVQRTETSHLWRKLGLVRIVSPRRIAVERIQNYVRSGYNANIVSLRRGQAQILERTLAPASPAAGCTLAEIKPPRGIIVGAVLRGDRVFVPRGPDRLEVGDTVILFVAEEHVSTVHLLFPGREPTASGAP
ncbi:MAG: Trk system potassium transporter TrkA [Thermoanaerobaculia bacterium]|nr:Trk system potassium transporter TrkA [Thermoanaerobaculia bacterium]